MELYPEQQKVFTEASKILDKWSMVYLALRPRFGKTPISVSLVSGKTLFVTTKSALTGIHKVIKALNKSDITVSTYGAVHKCVEKYDYLIIDESHTNISSFPKMSKAREKLQLIVDRNTKIKIIYLSGTPSIESSAQLYHQLSLSPRHSFSQYDSFYKWWNGSAHYKNKICNLPGYGIPGSVKYTGASRPAIDYSKVINFNEKLEPIMIRRAEEEAAVRIHTVAVEAPKFIQGMISNIRTKSIATAIEHVFIADGGASKLSKAHQFAGGTGIADDGESYILSNFKAAEVYKNHKGANCCIFYKYVKEKELLCAYFDEKDLYQADSNCTGIDLSHYDEMIIYSLTWSGSNYVQALNRLVNTERKDIPNIYIYLTNSSPDNRIYEAVSNKRDVNSKFLSV